MRCFVYLRVNGMNICRNSADDRRRVTVSGLSAAFYIALDKHFGFIYNVCIKYIS
mgnify:CR=1 FL=1